MVEALEEPREEEEMHRIPNSLVARREREKRDAAGGEQGRKRAVAMAEES